MMLMSSIVISKIWKLCFSELNDAILVQNASTRLGGLLVVFGDVRLENTPLMCRIFVVLAALLDLKVVLRLGLFDHFVEHLRGLLQAAGLFLLGLSGGKLCGAKVAL